MFTKETVEGIIEDCRLRAELFGKRHANARDAFVKVTTTGVDGGGLSTFGKSAVIGKDDVYECHDGYLYIHPRRSRDADMPPHREREEYSRDYGGRMLTESVVFIPYESIVAIECNMKAPGKNRR